MMIKSKRLDGKKKLVTLTKRLETDMRSFCRDKGVESESALVRRAIAKYIYAETLASNIEMVVKPILEEMGLFKGKEVSVKEVFEKYLKVCPRGTGPLGVFKGIIEQKLNLSVKKVRSNGKTVDFLFSYKQENDILNYDPRL